MPVVVEIPTPLRPFVFHGVHAEVRNDPKEATGDCPFCGRDGKLGISLRSEDDGRWQCLVCGEKGNPIQFLRKLHARSMEMTKSYEWIEAHRSLPIEALRAWGVCQSFLTHEWIIPAYLANGEIGNLYKYVQPSKDRPTGGHSRILMGTPTFHAGVFGYGMWDETKEEVMVCEGPWDGIALWDRLHRLRRNDTDNSLTPTTNEKLSLYKNYNVIATPGCRIFQESWLKFLDDKIVTLLYDNDYPKKNGDKVIVPAGYSGMKYAVNVMVSSTSADHPKEIRYLNWSGKDGGPTDPGYTEDYADGYDVRDLLSKKTGNAIDSYSTLMGLIKPVPTSWVEGKGAKRGSVHIHSLPCKTWKELTQQWHKAKEFIPGLERALACMTASIISVPSGGEQLWLKVVGPPSCGKSMLCEAVSVARKYVYPRSDINGFYSGYKTDKEGTKDYSLITKLWDRTLVTKDGDLLLQSTYRMLIQSQARDIYDGQTRKDFKNGMSREYEGLRMTWILCGTSALRDLDTSELGQRFLDVVIMEDIDLDLERNIILKGLMNQDHEMRVESNCKAESTIEREYLKAMQMTGGYIDYLRKYGSEMMAKIKVDPSVMRYCANLGTFVSYMRARPSPKQEEANEREIGTRLARQLYKLAGWLAVVLNKSTIDKEVLHRVRLVAMDTARGRTLEIVTAIHKAKVGLSAGDIARFTAQSPVKEGAFLGFLRRIKAVELYDVTGKPSASTKAKWRMTDAFRKLYLEVMK